MLQCISGERYFRRRDILDLVLLLLGKGIYAFLVLYVLRDVGG
jgi:hypothetical protein